MKLKTFWYRFGYLSVLILAPYLLIWVLPGIIYPSAYFRGLELIKLGDHHQDLDEEIEGVKLFQTMFPEICPSYVHLGNLYLRNHQSDLAIESYHYAWDSACLNADGMVNLLKSELSNPDQQKADLETWIRQHPVTNAVIYSALLESYETDGQYQQAAQLAEQWAKSMPDQIPAWEALFSYSIYFPMEIMQNYAGSFPVEKAALNYQIQQIIDAFILSTGEPEDILYYRLGTAYSNSGQWKQAEECFDKSIAIEPDRTESWVNLAIARKNQGKDSSSAIREAEKRAGESDTVRSLMGIYWRETDPEIAYVYWRKLIANQPDVPEWRIEAGASLAQMGDMEGGEALYQQAVALTPQRVDVLGAYAQFCLRYELDLSTTALEQTREMIQLAPQDPQGYILEGQILLATGDYLTAERMFLKALALDEKSVSANYYLGLMYRNLNEPARAWPYLQHASQSEESYYQRAAARLLDDSY